MSPSQVPRPYPPTFSGEGVRGKILIRQLADQDRGMKMENDSLPGWY